MAWQLTVWIPPLFIAGVVALVLAGRGVIYSLRNPEKTYLKAFSVTVGTIAVWEFTVAIIEASTSLHVKLIGYNVLVALVVPLVLYSLVWFALTFTGSDERVDRRLAWIVPLHLLGVSAAISLEPLLFYDVHLAVASQPSLFGLTPPTHVVIVRELKLPFVIFQLYAYGLMVVTAAVIGRFLLRQRDRMYWAQAVGLGIGIFLPVTANSLLFLGVIPSESHVTELSLLVTGLFVSMAVFRYRLLDLVPIARRSVIEEMRDGFVVCNEQNVVIDFNPRAGELLGSNPGGITGRRLPELLPPVAPLLREPNETTETEFETDVSGNRVYFHASVSKVGESGRLISFRDITTRKMYEQNLEEQNEKLELVNRMVRHDIGNDMTVISGNLQLLETHVEESGREYFDKVTTRTAHVQDLTGVLGDLMTAMLEADNQLEPTRLDAVIETVVESTSASYETAVVTIDGPIPSLSVTANAMLSSVFDNLLKNAIQHNDKSEPKVTVGVETNDETVVVTVADNGPGIPNGLRQTMFKQGEKALNSSGTGIGLYLVETLVRDFGGEIRVSDNDPEGTVFEVELPIAAKSAPVLRTQEK